MKSIINIVIELVLLIAAIAWVFQCYKIEKRMVTISNMEINRIYTNNSGSNLIIEIKLK